MNNGISQKCNLSADILSYMYGELPAAKCTRFESHLAECNDCTDEFAAISSARYEVYDWKKTEFETLATPVFVLPTPTASIADNASWSDRVRYVFGEWWTAPSVAFAGIAIISALAIMIYDPSETGSYVAQVNSNVSPVTESIQPLEDMTPTAPSVVAKENVAAHAPEPRGLEQAASVRSVQKPGARSTRLPVKVRADEARATRTPARTVPRLNEFVEEDDESLRLAQLFEDIDTRD